MGSGLNRFKGLGFRVTPSCIGISFKFGRLNEQGSFHGVTIIRVL